MIFHTNSYDKIKMMNYLLIFHYSLYFYDLEKTNLLKETQTYYYSISYEVLHSPTFFQLIISNKFI